MAQDLGLACGITGTRKLGSDKLKCLMLTPGLITSHSPFIFHA